MAGWCEKPPQEKWWEWEGEGLEKCPKLMVPDWFWGLIPLYKRLKKGVLPYSGGWLEQPAWYCSAMNEMMAMISRLEEERMREATKPKKVVR